MHRATRARQLPTSLLGRLAHAVHLHAISVPWTAANEWLCQRIDHSMTPWRPGVLLHTRWRSCTRCGHLEVEDR
jgi:hypothetical protein